MSETSPDIDVTRSFMAMSVVERQHFLVVYAYELTVLARMNFLDGKVERARECNEVLHSLMGSLRTSLSGQDTGAHESFIAMIAHVAQRRG
jgi:hypothetical protein